eukprot:366433-Chlamydomonas_euryale.AAC.24
MDPSDPNDITRPTWMTRGGSAAPDGSGATGDVGSPLGVADTPPPSERRGMRAAAPAPAAPKGCGDARFDVRRACGERAPSCVPAPCVPPDECGGNGRRRIDTDGAATGCKHQPAQLPALVASAGACSVRVPGRPAQALPLHHRGQLLRAAIVRNARVADLAPSRGAPSAAASGAAQLPSGCSLCAVGATIAGAQRAVKGILVPGPRHTRAW